MSIVTGAMPHQVQLQAPVSEAATGWKGQTIYAPATSLPARVEWKQRRVMAADGNMRMSQGRAIVDGDVTVTIAYRLLLPSGMVPQTPPIVAIEKNPGPWGGVDATVLYF